MSQPRQEEQPSDDHLFFVEVTLLNNSISNVFVDIQASRLHVLFLISELLFGLQAKLCGGKFVLVEARRKGFFSFGKQRVLCHNLVDLLRHLSRAFDNVRLSHSTVFATISIIGY